MIKSINHGTTGSEDGDDKAGEHNRPSKLIVVRVTGGIGSGKSTLCRELERLGATLFNADAVARKLMVEDPVLVKEIRLAFGKESYDADGKLNRKFLASTVFSDPDALQRLNAIVHPAVFRAFEQAIDTARRKGSRFLIYEAALLTDRPEGSPFDVNVVVDSELPERIARIQKRDLAERSAIDARVARQPSRNDYLDIANYVVTNDGSTTELEAKAGRLLSMIDLHFGGGGQS